MEKFFKNWFPTTLLAVGVVFSMAACGSDDDDSDDNQDSSKKEQTIDPDEEVPDPVGTIEIQMRNGNNGNTTVGNIRINEANNFAANDGYYNPVMIVSLGAMKGLGNVAVIPLEGWATEVAVKKGYGYVIFDSNSKEYYRFYVNKAITNISNEIIGWDVKYQKPFKGVDEELKPGMTEVSVGLEEFRNNEYPTIEVQMKNSSIVPFTVESSATWCRPELLLNEVSFIVNRPEVGMPAETATVTLTTLYGKSKTITVTRENPLYFNLTELTNTMDAYGGSFTCNIETNGNVWQDFDLSTNNVDWINHYYFDSYFNGYNSVYYLYYSVSENLTGSQRKGKIYVKKHNSQSVLATLTIVQKAM